MDKPKTKEELIKLSVEELKKISDEHYYYIKLVDKIIAYKEL